MSENRKIVNDILDDLRKLEISIFEQMYNNILYFLDNPSQTITLKPEFLNNLFYSHKKYSFSPILKKWEAFKKEHYEFLYRCPECGYETQEEISPDDPYFNDHDIICPTCGLAMYNVKEEKSVEVKK